MSGARRTHRWFPLKPSDGFLWKYRTLLLLHFTPMESTIPCLTAGIVTGHEGEAPVGMWTPPPWILIKESLSGKCQSKMSIPNSRSWQFLSREQGAWWPTLSCEWEGQAASHIFLMVTLFWARKLDRSNASVEFPFLPSNWVRKNHHHKPNLKPKTHKADHDHEANSQDTTPPYVSIDFISKFVTIKWK